MSLQDDNNTLLRESLGKGDVQVLKAGEGILTGGDWYCAHFPIDSVLSSIAFSSTVTISSGAQTTANTLTLPAGTTLFTRITGIGLTSGFVLLYKEHDVNTSE